MFQRPFLINNHHSRRAYQQKLQECGINTDDDLERQYKRVTERKSGLSRSQREFVIQLWEAKKKEKSND
jgi:hypothetical protein